jgi:excisionase family DNA binding protein
MSDRPYTVQELASRWCCPRQAVYRLIKSGRLPAFSVGERQLRVRREDADAVSLPQTYKRNISDQFEVQGSPEKLACFISSVVSAHPLDGGYVYFLQCQELVKIGYSKTPLQRWGKLQQIIPFDLEMLAYVQGSEVAEHALHHAFRSIRHIRLEEWFNASDDLRSAILMLGDASHA